MALPTFTAVGTGASGTAGISIPLPTHLQGDILLAVVEQGVSATLAPPSGWAHIPSSPRTTTSQTTLSVLWKRATSSAETDPAIPLSVNHIVGQAIGFRGCVGFGDPWNVASANGDNSLVTAFSATGATTTVPECLVVVIGGTGTDVATAEFSGWANADLANVTERIDFYGTAGNGGGVAVTTGEKAAAGAYGATTATIVTAAQFNAFTLALAPASAPPLPHPVSRLLPILVR